MKWRFINTGSNTGKFNMAFDIFLTKICRPDEAYFRLYSWHPFCISLGANQSIDSVNAELAASQGIDVVHRPTGGRAVLHSEELTYSVVMPISPDTSVKKIYGEINLALKEGLEIFNPVLAGLELETAQPDFRSLYREEKSAVCFAVPAKSELKYGNKKLVGSAQRRLAGTVLQHGSILTGSFHKNILKYLNLSDEGYNSLCGEIENTSVELNSVIDNDINYDILAECLLAGFEKHFGQKFERVDPGCLINSIEEIFNDV